MSEVTQLCLTLCVPMDCSLPGSSVYGIFQARVLEWAPISFSMICDKYLPNELHGDLIFRPVIIGLVFSFWPHCMACGIFVPQLGIEPGPSEVSVLSPNHWSARGFPPFVLLILHL